MTLAWHDVGDVRLPAVSVGASDGRPVLLLPGLTDGLAPLTDDDARRQLTAPPGDLLHGHRVHVASHRFPLGEGTGTRELAADAAVLLDRLADRPAVVVGHSMGAMVAQHLAVDRPDLVDRLVLSCTAGRADDTLRDVLERWAELVRRERWSDVAVEAIDRSYSGSAWLSRRVAQRVLPVKVPPPELARRHLVLTEACVTHDALDRLASVTAPTLVLAGGRDEVVRPHHARELADAFADASCGATVEVWDGLGHGLPEQAAGRFGRRVRRFLEEGT